jgi:hypothetical protein
MVYKYVMTKLTPAYISDLILLSQCPVLIWFRSPAGLLAGGPCSLWNTFPLEIRNSTSLKLLKSQLVQYTNIVIFLFSVFVG